MDSNPGIPIRSENEKNKQNKIKPEEECILVLWTTLDMLYEPIAKNKQRRLNNYLINMTYFLDVLRGK